MRARGILAVVVRPGSQRLGISVRDGAIEIRVAAPARDGLANRAACTALARALLRPPSSVTVLRGESSRRKLVQVDGLTADEALARISATGSEA